MSRTYRALLKAQADKQLRLVGGKLISPWSPDAMQDSSEVPSNSDQEKVQAVAELLHNKVLSQTFGEQGEYEVRTTLTTRQAWRYRCTVLHHGRVLKRAFPPIELDQTRDMRKVESITEEMRVALATEAVDMHFTRCAAVREYLVLAAIFSEPPPGAFRPLGITLIVLVCLAFAAGYWFWSHPIGAELEAPPVKASPHVVQWERKEVFYTHPAGEPFTFPLPALNGTSGDTPVEVTVDTSYLWPGWIEFNRDTLRISGVAPVIEQDKTYYLVFLAKADGGGESRLDVYLTITGQQASVQPQSSYHSVPSSAAPPRLESSVESQSPPLPPAISPTPNTAQESACLLKLLKGEPCSFGQDKDRGR